jgi:hypothetical protein
MAANTGRTVPRYTKVLIDNSAGALTEIDVNTIGGLNLDYPEVDLTAWNDAIHGVLLNTPSFTTTIGGPFDTVTHAVLAGVNGGNTPLAFDVRIGIRHAWEAGEPQFGISASATDGVLVKNYNVDPGNMTWSATVVMAAGSASPAWGTEAEA